MPPPLRCPALLSSTSCTKQICRASQTRSFSATSHRDQRITRARRAFFRWLGSNGSAFLHPLPGSTNYLPAYNAQGQLRRVVNAETMASKDDKKAKSGEESAPADQDPKNKKIPHETNRDLRVFPHNPHFISQPVLSEEFREAIWEKIMREGQSVREVSAQLRVEMSRVAAVVRLKEIEKEWQRIGKPLAKPYNEAIMSMLPKTAYDEHNIQTRPHESINDLPVHAATGQQIFHPTSESRHFTRADAARVFDEHLLPADDRVPHPELAMMHKDFIAGMTREEIQQRQQERDENDAKKKAAIAAKRAAKMGAVNTVQTKRWEFRITDVNVDDIGKDGRGPNGVGWRYGFPHMDRSRGQVRIPTRVQ